MKLKYYVRGLGIGIVVTAVIMGLSSGQNKMSDAQIKERAKELGMVEQTVLSDLNQSETEAESESDTQTAVETESMTEVTTETEVATKTVAEIQTEAENKVASEDLQETVQEETPENMANSSNILFEVRSGEGSGTVSKRLEQAGFIENAKNFDVFLCENGYDKKIRVGLHEITSTMTKDEIAKTLTKRP